VYDSGVCPIGLNRDRATFPPVIFKFYQGIYAKLNKYRFMVKFRQKGIQTKLFNIASAIFDATKTAASRSPNQKIKYIEYT
jgi:hypothetical protein